MVASNEGVTSEKDVADFRSALDDMGYSLIRFCELVAVNEGEEDLDQESKITQNVKKSFNRRMKQATLNKYWSYIADLPEFEKVGRVVLVSASQYLSRSPYRDKIMSTFDVD